MATDDVPSRRDRSGRRSWFPLRSGRPGSHQPGSGGSGSGGSGSDRPGRRARTAVIGVGVGGYAWAVGSTEPFSTISLVGVLIPGMVLAAIAYAWPPERIPPPDKLDITGVSYWAICVAALFEWEASAFRDNSLPWHPSLTDLINPMLGPHLVKSAAVLVWLLVGWGLVRR
jgi:hypothetical protein